jgi:hypothetical protein
MPSLESFWDLFTTYDGFQNRRTKDRVEHTASLLRNIAY